MLFGPGRRKQFLEASGIGAVGLEMAIATLLGAFGGSWLDERFATRPWLTTVGLIFGIAAGFRGLYRVVVRHERRMKAQREKEMAAGRALPPARAKKGPDGGPGTEEVPSETDE